MEHGSQQQRDSAVFVGEKRKECGWIQKMLNAYEALGIMLGTCKT
jgi:hypothetical protein